MLRLCLAIGMGLLCGPQDDSKKAIEDFKAKIKDARTVHEKALAIRALSQLQRLNEVLHAGHPLCQGVPEYPPLQRLAL